MIVSTKQYEEHYELYQSYIEKVNKLLARTENTRAWSRDFNYAYAGARLHELYFEHLDSSPARNRSAEGLITASFGSLDNWRNSLVELAKTCRPAGWALTCWNTHQKVLMNIAFDSHDGLVPDMIPIVVLDAYEHSFMIDYGIDKESYFERFVDSMNWNLVWDRVKGWYN